MCMNSGAKKGNPAAAPSTTLIGMIQIWCMYNVGFEFFFIASEPHFRHYYISGGNQLIVPHSFRRFPALALANHFEITIDGQPGIPI